MFNLQSHQAVANGTTTFEEARRGVVEYAETELGLKEYMMYAYDSTKTCADIHTALNGTFTAPENVYSFCVDASPRAQWSNKCHYVFVSRTDGRKNVIQSSSMLLREDWEMLSFKCNETSRTNNVSCLDYVGLLERDYFEKSGKKQLNKYAVIISGGVNKHNSYHRYWNDCSLFYQYLVNVEGYPKENIYVLFGRGPQMGDEIYADMRLDIPNYYYELPILSPKDLDNDGEDDIFYGATKEDISNVFDELSERMTWKDDLFLFTTDHGDPTGLNLWLTYDEEGVVKSNILTHRELSDELDKVRANKIDVLMAQCFSGGFIEPLKRNNLTIATACNDVQVSFCDETYTFEEFAFHFICALSGMNPFCGEKVDADADHDGEVSMREAFDYAKEKDDMTKAEYVLDPDYEPEIPMFYEPENVPTHVECALETGEIDCYITSERKLRLSAAEVVESVNIYSLQSELVYSIKPGTESMEVDLGELECGIYILEVRTTNGLTTKKLIIK